MPTSSAAPPPARPPARPPLVLRVGLLLVLVELAALAALAVSMVVEAVGGGARQGATSVVMGVFFLGIAVLLGLAVRALHRGDRWGRGPVLTWQLLLLAIGASQAAILGPWLTVALVVVPAAVVVALVVPASREWTDSAEPPRAVV